MQSGRELRVLVFTTLHVYREAFRDAVVGFARNWYVPGIHVGYLVLSGLAMQLSALFGYPVGGFVFSFILTGFVASYYATVSSAVEREKVKLQYLWEEMLPLYAPFLNTIFILWLINFVVGAFSHGPVLLHVGITVLMVVVFNPLPEIITATRHRSLQGFAESVEFVAENFVEWFLPFLVPAIIASLFNFGLLLVFFSTTNPLVGLKYMLTWMGGIVAAPETIVPVIIFLALVYFIFIFRLALYKRLAISSRRKRCYQYRMGDLH